MTTPEANEPSDDELFNLIGTLGAGMHVASDSDLDQPLRDLGQHVAETAADKLSDIKKNGPQS